MIKAHQPRPRARKKKISDTVKVVCGFLRKLNKYIEKAHVGKLKL